MSPKELPCTSLASIKSVTSLHPAPYICQSHPTSSIASFVITNILLLTSSTSLFCSSISHKQHDYFQDILTSMLQSIKVRIYKWKFFKLLTFDNIQGGLWYDGWCREGIMEHGAKLFCRILKVCTTYWISNFNVGCHFKSF